MGALTARCRLSISTTVFPLLRPTPGQAAEYVMYAPLQLRGYIRGVVSRVPREWLGHDPATPARHESGDGSGSEGEANTDAEDSAGEDETG